MYTLLFAHYTILLEHNITLFAYCMFHYLITCIIILFLWIFFYMHFIHLLTYACVYVVGIPCIHMTCTSSCDFLLSIKFLSVCLSIGVLNKMVF